MVNWRAWLGWWRRGELELDEEIRTHLELETERQVALGLAPEAARRAAARTFGNRTLAAEDSRAVWRIGPLATWLQDVRVGARLLRRAPGFSLAAVLTLGLGIGASTTIFGWAKAALLEPLAGVPRQHEVVVLAARERSGRLSASTSYPDFVDYRDSSQSLAGLLAESVVSASLTVTTGVERVWGALVSGNYFAVLEVRPTIGRAFHPDEAATFGGRPVAVLSDGAWRTRFGGDPGIVGRTVLLEGFPYTVVGVAPPGFVGAAPGLALEFWVPLTMKDRFRMGFSPDRRTNRWLEARARLRPGVTLARVNGDLEVIARRIEQDHPAQNNGRSAVLLPMWRAPGGAAEMLLPIIVILGGVVAVLLAIACANVASLLLTRTIGRQHEIAVRLTLGAGRWRIVRQLAVESLLVAALGGVVGLILARWSAGLLMAFAPPLDLPIHFQLGFGWSAAGFALALVAVTAVGIGMIPALSTFRTSLASTLNVESVRFAGRGHRALAGNALVVAQVALSLALLVGAGLFLRSLVNASLVSPGFDARPVLLASTNVYPSGYDESTAPALYQRLVDRVGSLPGVEAVSLGRSVPLSGHGISRMGLKVDLYQPDPGEEISPLFNIVSPDYFRTMSIQLVAGRDFSMADTLEAPPRVVINEALAARYLAGRNPIGATVRLFGHQEATIIGVVRTTKYLRVNEPPLPLVYLSLLQFPESEVRLHVRASGDPAALASSVREAVRSVDRSVPVYGVTPMRETLRFAFFAQRLGGYLLSVFGMLALSLAAVGLYAVVAHALWRRIRELGVRAALGATPADLRRLVVKHGVLLLAIGLPFGLAGAVGLGFAARSQLYGVGAFDPLTAAGATLMLAAVILLAAGIPAWRAGRLSVVTALRQP